MKFLYIVHIIGNLRIVSNYEVIGMISEVGFFNKKIKMILKLKSLEFERFVLLYMERNEIFHLMDDLSQV